MAGSMVKRNIVKIDLDGGNVRRSWINHSIGLADNLGDAFGVEVYRSGEAWDLTGATIMGFFHEPWGNNIVINGGDIMGNMAIIYLPQACYNHEGQFTLALKIVTDRETSTMVIFDGMVDNTNTGSAVAPTGTVPTYQEVLAVYDQMLEAKAGSVRFDIVQSLTDAQKLQAQNNMGAYYQPQIDTVNGKIGSTALPTTAQTLTGAIAEHEGDLTNQQGQITDLKSALKEVDYLRGVELLDGATAYEQTGINCILKVYTTGDGSYFDGWRIKLIANASSYNHVVKIVNPSNSGYDTTYNATTGENVYSVYPAYNAIHIVVDWETYGSTYWINRSSYSDSHVQFYSKSVDTVISDSYYKSVIEDSQTRKYINGFFIVSNVSEKQAAAYKLIQKAVFTGDASVFAGLRMVVVTNSGNNDHLISCKTSGGTTKRFTYDTSSGWNYLIEGDSRIDVLFDWTNYTEGLINQPGYDSAFIECAGISTVVAKSSEGTNSELDEIKNFDLKVFSKVAFAPEASVIRGYASHRAAGGYKCILSDSYGYGFYVYPVLAGEWYNVTVNDLKVYATAADLLFSEQLLENDMIIDEKDVYYSAPYENSDYFPYVSYSISIKAPKNGYIMVYSQYFELAKITVSRYTDDLGEVHDYVLDLDHKIIESKGTAKPRMDIVCAGSSITWGSGSYYDSMVKVLDDIIHNEMANTVPYTEMKYTGGTVITNSLMRGGKGILLTGNNTTIEFDIFGDEIAICHAKRRSNNFGIIKVMADGTEIGRFDNYNPIQSAEETFTGDDLREIVLAHPCTFNHQIYINGSATALTDVVINTAGYSGTMPDDANAFVFRKPVGTGEENCHAIEFADSLPTITSVRVTYDYGRMIAYERSNRGQTTADEYENESAYGAGTVSYDPAHPIQGYNSGLEFRGIDRRAFFVHKFNDAKTRHIKLQIIGGTNPYMLINFATNRYHNIMNAGIGGWTVNLFGESNVGMNKYGQFYKWFRPSIIYQESMTNDDWSFGTRRINRSIGEVTLSDLQKMHWLEMNTVTYNSSTGKYAVTVPTGIISSITSVSLISTDIIGTGTVVGDIVRIGNYHGDIKQVVCRRITSVDLTTGEIGWKEPLFEDQILNVNDLSDLVGAEINIRDLSGYKTQYETLVTKIHDISPETMIVVVQNGLPNLWTRQLWGYELIHEDICKGKPFMRYLDAREYLYNAEFDNITGTKSETLTSTGASEYELNFNGNDYAAWAGFKVLVNGIDVYGKDAYVEINESYYLKSGISGSSCNKANTYSRSNAEDKKIGKMKLVFTQNVPVAGASIVVQFADEIWSSDFTHPNTFGALAYGKAYASVLK